MVWFFCSIYSKSIKENVKNILFTLNYKIKNSCSDLSNFIHKKIILRNMEINIFIFIPMSFFFLHHIGGREEHNIITVTCYYRQEKQKKNIKVDQENNIIN